MDFLRGFEREIILGIIALAFYLLNRYLRRRSQKNQNSITWKDSTNFGEISNLPKLRATDYIGTISLVLTILFAAILTLLFLVESNSPVYSYLMWSLLIMVIPVGIAWGLFILKYLASRAQRNWMKPFQELARVTGLKISFRPDNRYLGYYYPSAQGEYRGRSLSMTIGGDYIHASYSIVPGRVNYHEINLPVNNQAGFSLAIQPVPIRLISGKSEGQRREDADLDIRATGSPVEYVESAKDLITRRYPRLPIRKRSNRISIELHGDTLLSKQYDYKSLDVTNQSMLMNLLVDLANLTEEMQFSIIPD